MDLTKAPIDPGSSSTAGQASRPPTSTSTPVSTTVPVSPSSSSPAAGDLEQLVALADRLEIRPLDLAGALRILIAEVQADLGFPGDLPDIDNPARVTQALVQMFLQAVPETLAPAAWLVDVTQLEATLESALDKAVDTIATWRDVTQDTVDVAVTTRAAVSAVLTDEPPNPVWLRPEWLGLTPQFRRYRRRRIAARRFSDPDLYARELARMSEENDSEHWGAK